MGAFIVLVAIIVTLLALSSHFDKLSRNARRDFADKHDNIDHTSNRKPKQTTVKAMKTHEKIDIDQEDYDDFFQGPDDSFAQFDELFDEDKNA